MQTLSSRVMSIAPDAAPRRPSLVPAPALHTALGGHPKIELVREPPTFGVSGVATLAQAQRVWMAGEVAAAHSQAEAARETVDHAGAVNAYKAQLATAQTDGGPRPGAIEVKG